MAKARKDEDVEATRGDEDRSFDSPTEQETPASVQQGKSSALSPFRQPTGATTLSIPSHWADNPRCGEYQTTLDETDEVQAKIVARSLAGKTVSGKSAVNKPLAITGLTMEPFQSKPNDQGEIFSKIGFHLHCEKGLNVFVAHYNATKDVLALIRRFGVPTTKNVIHAIIESIESANTYRLIAADLVD